MITCPLCTKVFPGQSVLNNHMVSHTKEKPYKCHICSAAFGTKYDRKKHIKSVHDGIKRTQKRNSHCSLCSYKCYSITMLRAHLRTHSTEQPFSCKIPSCGFKTKHKKNLQQHILAVHNNERPHECPSEGCNYKGKSRIHLKSHLKFHSNEKPFACKVQGCNYTAKCKSSLSGHTFRIHSDEKPFKCSTCDFRAKTRREVVNHERTHEKIKHFQCQVPYCGFASHRKDKLKLHFYRKHVKKNVLCTAPGCNFRCGSTTLLKEHLKCHDKPILKCPRDSCHFVTRFRKTLLSHISLRHESFPPESRDNKVEKRKYVCKFCFSRLTARNGLEDHLRRHTGEKPYRCSCCQYTTAFKMKLRDHARTHDIHVIPRGKEDQVRKCRTCNRTFWSYSELILHSLIHLEPVVVLQQLNLEFG